VYAIDGNGCRLFFFDKSGSVAQVQIVKPIKDKNYYHTVLAEVRENLNDYFEITRKKLRLEAQFLVKIGAAKDYLGIVRQWSQKNEDYYRKMVLKLFLQRWRGSKPLIYPILIKILHLLGFILNMIS